MITVIYDIETLASCFTYTAIDKDSRKVFSYVLHKERFELEEFIQHLKFCKGQVGFNNLSFDYPVIHYILDNYKKWQSNTREEIITLIYQKAQELIENQNNKNYSSMVPYKLMKIKQLDLFKMWHYNNHARSTSLKALEISMRFPNVMEMPIDHTEKDITLEQIENILEYNLNDVLATEEFYRKSIELGKIILRKKIQKEYGLPCISWNNGKIGENLLLQLFCNKTGRNIWKVKESRTYREKIALKDCIPKGIVFSSKEFNKLMNFYNNKVITETKGSVDYFVNYKGIKYVYGTGGIHAAIESGVYQSDDQFIIKSADVSSLHPNLPIVYRFYPEHLGPEFLDVYKNGIVGVRLAEKAKPKKEQDKTIIDGFKEAANIPYGKSNEKNSFLYDPLYSMKTTIASQFVITMLCERLCEIPNSQMLMVNTDGCEIRIPKEYEDLYSEICKQWEKETNLVLEFQDYKKMWISDINTYGALTFDNKIKNKGRFEVDKVVGGEPAYHKDNSFRIIPLAIQEFFMNGTSPEKTITNHRNNRYEDNENFGIYDFCGRQKFKRDSKGETHNIIYKNNNPYEVINNQQKNVRYYISKSGETFIKVYDNGKTEFIHKDYLVTIFNRFEDKEWKDYNIDYSFYIKECYKEINNIILKQLSLKI